MTLPDERRRAINNTREFLRGLLDPKKTPRVPKSIRLEAAFLLKHYPSTLYLESPNTMKAGFFDKMIVCKDKS